MTVQPDASARAPEAPRFPLPSSGPHEPPEAFAALRASCPVARVTLPTGDPAWLVTRYADNRTVLADPAFSRAAAASRAAPRARLIPLDRTAITVLDPPEHTRLRSLVAPAFTARRVARLAPVVEETVTGLVDRLVAAGPGADFVAIVARPLALTVIARLLGLPESGYDRLRRNTDAYLSVDAHTPQQMRAAVDDLKDLLGELLAACRREPGDDLVSLLAGAGQLADEEIVTFGVTLLVAGYETVSAHLTNSLLVFGAYPDQWARLRDDPELLPGAVEELLRFTAISPAGGTIRVATRDVVLGDVPVRAGEAVLPSTVAANRDPAAFSDAERFDVTRTPGPHLAFGHGVHRCLGAGLARLELRVTLGVLLRRLPELRIAVAPETLDWKAGKMIRGMETLPVTW